MKDRIIRGTAKDGDIRFFAAVTTNLVDKASQIHNCSPVASAALGRMLTAASMMGTMLKNSNDSVTVQINGKGETGPIVTVADNKGMVKGYIGTPDVNRPLNDLGKLDVGGAVGKDGFLTVIKDMGLKEPYVGQVPIVSGEIAEDITYYFASSEQVPSAVSLGVLVGTDAKIEAAGGFIIQMMPGADDFVRDIIEYRLDEIKPVTKTILDVQNVEGILTELLDGMNMKVMEEYYPDFYCGCSRDKVEKVLMSIGRKDLEEMAQSKEDTEIVCHFCNKKYVFTGQEIGALMAEEE
jgi:Disulfide bond chaperones of the HSP33 family